MINVHSSDERYSLHITCSYIAVRESFPHLTVRQIIEPPHEYFDAALARQIVIHLMNQFFAWPRRRIAEHSGRSRESIHRAIRTIDDRLTAASPVKSCWRQH
ncbi:hypothetical protein [Rhizobium alvei]|uniref:Uncharacterized protein n=1 Tax=Rhizobium alvei TaxID=1132659 RepID=A0ABT8YTF6_9HYPH|nr:hypothetical protein [Rhizobium alvei]MDO6967024.1 hypothetical protein [Rhizobium alvei]